MDATVEGKAPRDKLKNRKIEYKQKITLCLGLENCDSHKVSQCNRFLSAAKKSKKVRKRSIVPTDAATAQFTAFFQSGHIGLREQQKFYEKRTHCLMKSSLIQNKSKYMQQKQVYKDDINCYLHLVCATPGKYENGVLFSFRLGLPCTL